MQVSVETTSNLGRKLSIVVPAEQIEEKVKVRLNELTKQVKLDGFRPGKVPASVVKQRFGANARQEVIGQVLQQTLFEALEKEQLNPAGLPEIDSIKSEAGQPLEYSAIFEIYPSIELKDLAGVTAEKISAEVTSADIEEMLESVRKQRAQWEPVERACEMGDKITIDFEGFKDGEAFEGGKAEGHQLELGSNAFIPGFEEGLVGHKAGDEVKLNLTFPEDYQAEDLAGQKVLFEVKVKEVNTAKLPELNEDFIKSMGIESGELETFKKQISEHMQRELEQTVQNRQKENLFEQLLKKHEFEIPKALVDNEIKNMLQRYMPNHEPEKAQIDNVPEQIRKDCEKRVAIGLLVAEIIRQKEIKVDHDKVKAFVEKQAQSYENPEQMVSWYYADRKRLQGVESIVLEQQVFDKICEEAKVEEKSLSYNQVMKPNQQ